MIALIHYLFEILFWIIFIDIILSWVIAIQRPRWAYHPIVQLIHEISSRILRPFRRFMDRIGLRTGPIDFSPILAMLALRLVEMILIRILFNIGIR